MCKPPVSADSPCRIEGCTQPRHITTSGVIRNLCIDHLREYTNAYGDKRRAKQKASRPPRLNGRPRPPTIIVDERARVVSRVRGNTVEREFPLPPEGLRAETIWILKRRGWQIRVEGRAS